jgi:hypothetical protein
MVHIGATLLRGGQLEVIVMPILLIALIALGIFIVVGILSVTAARAEARAQAEGQPKPGGRSHDAPPEANTAATAGH